MIRLTYRDAETGKDLANGVYVADQDAADIVNACVRYQGAEIDHFTEDIPASGEVKVITFYGA